MQRPIAIIIALFALAGVVHAHAGTKDPAVKAWMANMKEIGAQTKTLGLMARGQTAFDADDVQRALSRIEALSRDIPVLFRTRAQDPTSEARATIWSDWSGFEAEAATLTEIAATTRITDVDALGTVVTSLGATCKSCHGTYRDG